MFFKEMIHMHFISNGVLFNICKLKKGEEYGYKNIKSND